MKYTDNEDARYRGLALAQPAVGQSITPSDFFRAKPKGLEVLTVSAEGPNNFANFTESMTQSIANALNLDHEEVGMEWVKVNPGANLSVDDLQTGKMDMMVLPQDDVVPEAFACPVAAPSLSGDDVVELRSRYPEKLLTWDDLEFEYSELSWQEKYRCQVTALAEKHVSLHLKTQDAAKMFPMSHPDIEITVHPIDEDIFDERVSIFHKPTMLRTEAKGNGSQHLNFNAARLKLYDLLEEYNSKSGLDKAIFVLYQGKDHLTPAQCSEICSAINADEKVTVAEKL